MTEKKTLRDPLRQYDCEDCKFSWCCGPECACDRGLLPASPERQAEVEAIQEAWRQRRK